MWVSRCGRAGRTCVTTSVPSLPTWPRPR
jgi:hypothetical protein